MTFKKIVAVFLSLATAVTALAGCGNKKDFLLYYEMDTRPSIIDPQLAESTDEQTVVLNTFEGLMRIDSSGNAVNAVASDVIKSDDGLSYTFTISNNAIWSDDVKVTADDFVFAFERAKSAKTAAPYGNKLNIVKNFTATGVNTFYVFLEYKDEDFLKTLSLPVAMPCRRDFFNKCGGKYGLNADSIVTNGSYNVNKWVVDKSEDFSMRLSRSKIYNGISPGNAASVNFSVSDNKDDRIDRISVDSLDMAFIGADKKAENVSYVSFENTVYILSVNKNCDLGSASMRDAFSKTIHRNRIENDLGSVFDSANQLFPPVVKIGEKSANEVCNKYYAREYDPDSAIKSYKKAVSASGTIDASSILYYGEDEGKLAGLIAESFQQSLSVYINIEQTESLSELTDRVVSKNYKIALIPIKADSSNPIDFLSSVYSLGIIGSKEFSPLISNARKLTQVEQINSLNKALDIISNENSIFPVAFKAEIFAYNSKYICNSVNCFGGIVDFSAVMAK